MKIAVLHVRAFGTNPNPRLAALASARERLYEHVATVTVESTADLWGACEIAFSLTNHIDHSWCKQPVSGVRPTTDCARSTSMNDIMITDNGEIVRVDGIGMRLEPFNTALKARMVETLFGVREDNHVGAA